MTGERLQMLTYARHSWSLSSESSLACNTFCDTGASVYDGHPRGPVTLSPNAEHLAVELSLPIFYDKGLSRLGFEQKAFRFRGEPSNPLRYRCGCLTQKYVYGKSIIFIHRK